MDERGFFKIVDRKKDMILVSGFNVYPNEVEEVVANCPGVMECAAVGVPDDKSGEAVKLVIVKKDPDLTEAQVREYCRHELTGYKQPKVIEFRTDLPKTPVGKILRRELRDKKCREGSRLAAKAHVAQQREAQRPKPQALACLFHSKGHFLRRRLMLQSNVKRSAPSGPFFMGPAPQVSEWMLDNPAHDHRHPQRPSRRTKLPAAAPAAAPAHHARGPGLLAGGLAWARCRA